MKIIYIVLGVLLACNTVEKNAKAPEKLVRIFMDDDGGYTVFTRYDTSATFVRQTRDGELLDSTWLLAKPGVHDDTLIRNYYRMVYGSKAQ